MIYTSSSITTKDVESVFASFLQGRSMENESSTPVNMGVLSGGESLQNCDYCRILAALLVKFSGLVIPDPSVTSEANFELSTCMCSHLLSAFRGNEPFSSTDHNYVQTAVTSELKSHRTEKLQL
jgi:hypothetical protein